MFKHVDYTMVMVSDMAKSVAFYRDVIGLKLKMESPEWTEFDTGVNVLALHHTSGKAPAPHQGPPQAGTCSIGFSVEDLHHTVEALKKKGAHFVMPPTERPEEGIHLAVCVDPDGLGISFAQPLKKPAGKH
ncbi:MAG TPA: VOC family protein [Candidatus Xenobia bacterium]|jgi:lactoylglutathione lyase